MSAVTNTAPKADGRVVPWNKGKLIGQKPPLKLKEIWAIRIRLQLDHRARELALFNLAIDSKSYAGAIWSHFASMMWSRAVIAEAPNAARPAAAAWPAWRAAGGDVAFLSGVH